MSSTNKTANVGLNQWVRTDPFCMDDFNEDNAKIDTALKSAQIRDKLFEVEINTDTSTMELDFEGIDLSQYLELKIYSDLAGQGSSPYVRLRVNNISTAIYNYYNSTGYDSYHGLQLGLTSIDLVNPKKLNISDFWGKGSSIQRDSDLRTINSLQIYCVSGEYGNPIRLFVRGTKISVYGVRK